MRRLERRVAPSFVWGSLRANGGDVAWDGDEPKWGFP